MKVESVQVVGLFGKNETLIYEFNSDLNIITGRNGSGKTTIMKLMWFIISGNILLALKEINFKSCKVVTDIYECTVYRTGPAHCRVTLDVGGREYTFEDEEGAGDEPFLAYAEDQANSILRDMGGSIFFPTFRRIEGGFSMAAGAASRTRSGNRVDAEIDDSLSSLSRKLSQKQHLFITAISTHDVTSLLLKRYASFSEDVNSFQAEVSRHVIDKIRQYERTQSDRSDADALLSETRAEIEKIEGFRSDTMKPLDAIKALVEKLFQHSGIMFEKRLSFGDAAAAVASDALSAGEKQLLSFICYNAFHKDSVIFIDEPELSLHVDWQRQIYPILHSQNSGNQFVFATHSPFIYGKYPDKEVLIGADKGE
ncbi:AAA family ATPase [Pseudomonas sp. LJDD11]|uniref:AAA family ATPase n=1 Tax=Pseudomonas sp. LJDD11 TaxID=2931984 RepID=UPI00211BD819|nr:ATP-binding protein [Pseudomonas sp. LJDD11]MCQ9423390.1 AAA family ATPase [Pseudomonas sp. LJDD11]